MSRFDAIFAFWPKALVVHVGLQSDISSKLVQLYVIPLASKVDWPMTYLKKIAGLETLLLIALEGSLKFR